MTKPLYLLDSHAIIYRSHFAFVNRPLRNNSGVNISAAFGFFRFLFSLFAERNPGAFAAVFDSRGPTFRHDMFPEYKATRQKTPEELIAQIPLVEELLVALGVPLLRKDGYEADDIIATLARRCAREGRQCWVVSGDKDLLQLVGGPVRALRPGEGFSFRSFGPEEVQAEWGVGPERILDYLALTGDASDNIPGVLGIGDKTAQKLLAEYRDLDDIYSRLDTVKPDGVRRKLEAGRDSAMMSRALVRLADDIDLGLASLDLLEVEALDRAKASPIFLREGMRSLAQGSAPGTVLGAMPGAAQGSAPGSAPGEAPFSAAGSPAGSRTGSAAYGAGTLPSGATQSAAIPGGLFADPATGAAPPPGQPITTAGTAAAGPEASGAAPGSPAGSPRRSPGGAPGAQPGAPPGLPPELVGPGTYETVTDEASLDAWVAACVSAGSFALDTETDGLDPLTANMVGFSLSATPGKACYVPLARPDGPCIDAGAVRSRLAALLSSGSLVVGHNIKFDRHVLRRFGAPISGPIADTMVAAWLLDPESGSFALESLAERRLGLKGLEWSDILPSGGNFTQVGTPVATRYAGEDADFTLRLWRLFSAELAGEGLDRLFRDVEMPLVPILESMEEAGITVNAAELRAYGVELESSLSGIQREIWKLVGHEFNIASTKQLQEVLFIERKLPVQKRTKTGYSTDTTVLEELAPLDPVPELILKHRSLAKLKSTYVDTLASLAEASGRVHTSYLQTGAATGRLSSRDPNLQNIPIRDEEGRRIRMAFVASPGNVLVSADYAQIELVVMAHLSGDPGLHRAFAEGADVHRRTAALIFGVDEGSVTPEQRRIAKTINFGVIYGMSAFRLANELRIPRGRAQEFIDAYFQTYSGVAEFIRRTVEETEATGFSTTILGRRRFIPAINSRNRNERQGAQRVAVNTPIQGSAADIVKLAMLRVDAALKRELPRVRMLLQVHDELLLESPVELADKACALVGREMESAYALSVPLRTSMETAYRWGDLH